MLPAFARNGQTRKSMDVTILRQLTFAFLKLVTGIPYK